MKIFRPTMKSKNWYIVAAIDAVILNIEFIIKKVAFTYWLLVHKPLSNLVQALPTLSNSRNSLLFLPKLN